MRMKTIKVLITVARGIQRVLDVRVPMGEVYGLRIR
jgi:hypothetical protein